MDKAATWLLWLLALVHFVPAIAAIFPAQIARLYGVSPDEQALTTLLQHRAVLLGLIGAGFAAAAIVPALRKAALIGGSISMASFILIWLSRDGLAAGLDGPLAKIALADALALPVALLLLLKLKTP